MSESFLQIEKLMSAFGDPEYRFLLLESLILFGIIFGLVLFITTLFLRSAKLQTAALIVIGLSAMVHVPYLAARSAAQPRMEQVHKIKSPNRVEEFNQNSIIWRNNSWKYFLLAVVAGAAVLVGAQRNRLGLGLAVVTVLLSLAGIKNALWLNYRDSLAYHPNLKIHQAPIDSREKYSPPPRQSAPPAIGTSISQSSRVTQPSKPKSETLSGQALQRRPVVPMKAVR